MIFRVCHPPPRRAACVEGSVQFASDPTQYQDESADARAYPVPSPAITFANILAALEGPATLAPSSSRAPPLHSTPTTFRDLRSLVSVLPRARGVDAAICDVTIAP